MSEGGFSHKDDDEFFPPLRITWIDVTDKNVKQLKVLNSVIFPINYADQFYKDAINAPPGFVKLACFNEVAVGAVCCRKERYVANHAEFHKKRVNSDTFSSNSTTDTKSSAKSSPSASPNPDKSSKANDSNSNANAAANGLTKPNAESSSNHTEASSPDPNKYSMYILTLGVLAAYRERGIGKQLINYVFDLIESSPLCKDVVDVYVHVQSGNEDALRFYDRYGFRVTEKLENYYKRIKPADCLVVRKEVNQR